MSPAFRRRAVGRSVSSRPIVRPGSRRVSSGKQCRRLPGRAEQGAGDEAERHPARELGGKEEEEGGVEDRRGDAAAEHRPPDQIDARGRRPRRPPPRHLPLPAQLRWPRQQGEPEGEKGGAADDPGPPRLQPRQRADSAHQPAEERAGQGGPCHVERPQTERLSFPSSTEEAQANGHVDRSGGVRAQESGQHGQQHDRGGEHRHARPVSRRTGSTTRRPAAAGARRRRTPGAARAGRLRSAAPSRLLRCSRSR